MLVRNTPLFTWSVVAVGLLGFASAPDGLAAPITGSTLDAYLEEQEAAGDENAVGPAIIVGQGATPLTVGVRSFPGGDNQVRWGQSAIFVFQLPAEPAGGVLAADVDFAFTLISKTTGGSRTNADADLYGLPFNTTGTINPAYHFDGAFGTDATTGVMAIQQSILVNEATGSNPTPAGTRVSTSLLGDAALATYLQAQYDAGAVAGNYVFLRINRNDNTVDNVARNYKLASAEDTANAPVLTMPIPEPASLAVLGLGGLLAMRRRRSA